MANRDRAGDCDGDGDELNSCEKLSNETTSNVTSNDDEGNSSKSPHQHIDDSLSFSSPESTSMSPSISANSVIDTLLIDTRHQNCYHHHHHHHCDEETEKRSQIFTDGEYFYGPYDFDLFSNEFYQFRDGNVSDIVDKYDECANDDEAEKLLGTENDNRGGATMTMRTRCRSSGSHKLLKNHDEVDNNAEVSLVRDVDAVKGCETYRNSCYKTKPNIEINVTNWSDDESEDFTATIRRDDDDDDVHVAFDRNFNYEYASMSEALCDRNLIELIDEGDNDVSNNHGEANPFGDMQVERPTQLDADNFDAPFILSVAEQLNNSQQFNYELDKIAETTVENEYLYGELPLKSERSETCDDAMFSNDERRGFIFGDNVVDRHSFDDTQNEIRFKERDEKLRQPTFPQLHPLADTKCDEPDNCFLESKIDEGDDRG